MLMVRDVMTPDVLTVRPEATLTQLDKQLVDAKVSGAPVVEDGAIIGIVSQTDVVRTLYGEQLAAREVSAFYGSPFPIPLAALAQLSRDSRRIADHMTQKLVRDIMTPAPGRIAPDASIEEAARMMSEKGFHRVPVVDGDRLVGIISTLDIVRLVGDGSYIAKSVGIVP